MRNPSGGDWNDDLRVRLAGLRLSPVREAEIVEELSQHLDDRYEELRAAGSSDADARRLALEELSEAGGLTQRMQSLSQVNQPAPVVPGQLRPGVLRGLWQDVQYAARTARRQPAFAATIVATLAIATPRRSYRRSLWPHNSSPSRWRCSGRSGSCCSSRAPTSPT